METGNKKGAAYDPCRAFQDLLEKKLTGAGEPGETDDALLEEHARTCPDCAAFEKALELVAEVPPVPSGERDRLIERAWAGFQRRRRNRRAAFAGLAAAAALLILFLGLWVFHAVDGRPELRLVKGRLTVNDADAAPGRLLHATDEMKVKGPLSVLSSEDLMTLAMDGAARLSLARLDENGVHLDLHGGTLAVRLERPLRDGLTVNTPKGSVTAAGTVFAVTMGDRDARVDVVQGSVRVIPAGKDAKAVVVKAGWSLFLGKGEAVRLEEAARRRILAMLAGLSEQAGDPLKIAAADVSPGSEGSGKTREPGPETEEREVAKELSSKPTLKALFDLARSCRANKDWTCSAGAYKKITTIYPGTPDAVTVLVSLGEIQLDHLEAPEDALRNFETYLKKKPGGSLAKEAHHGKIRALRVLGRKSEEIKALEQFMKLYPDSLEAPKVEKRLKEMGKAD